MRFEAWTLAPDDVTIDENDWAQRARGAAESVATEAGMLEVPVMQAVAFPRDTRQLGIPELQMAQLAVGSSGALARLRFAGSPQAVRHVGVRIVRRSVTRWWLRHSKPGDVGGFVSTLAMAADEGTGAPVLAVAANAAPPEGQTFGLRQTGVGYLQIWQAASVDDLAGAQCEVVVQHEGRIVRSLQWCPSAEPPRDDSADAAPAPGCPDGQARVGLLMAVLGDGTVAFYAIPTRAHLEAAAAGRQLPRCASLPCHHPLHVRPPRDGTWNVQ